MKRKHTKRLFPNRKGSQVFSLITTAVLSIIVIFLALTIGADIMQGISDTQTADTSSANVSRDSLELVSNVSERGSSIGLIVGMAILLLIMVFMFGKIMTGFGGRQ